MSKPKIKPQQRYTVHYKTQCFNTWYSMGRPDMTVLHAEMDEDEHGRKPLSQILLNWRHEENWDVHGDDLDARANAIVDDELVNHRVLMLKEMASKGKELQRLGIDWIRKNKFDTSSSAVSAVFKGAELERTSRGISERLVKMLKMDDEKLTERVQRLLDKASDAGEIIDVAPVEEEKEDA